MHLFDIIGPVMVGPSSSHTAGAARMGLIAREILGDTPSTAIISLHGSFAKTYQGHGTDRALVGGLLGMRIDDPRLRDSLTLAREAGLTVEFRQVQLRGAHPNTAILAVTGQKGKTITLKAASIGGGAIRILSMNGLDVGFSGEENTIVVQHRDTPGVIAKVSGLLSSLDINIATMRVFRRQAGAEAVMVLEVDGHPGQEALAEIRRQQHIESVAFLEKRKTQ